LILNNIFNSADIPDSFKNAIIYPLFKKGDDSNPANYRGIAFMNCIAKIFTGVMLGRLNTWAENNNTINEFQAAFRKNYSTNDNIFNLTSIIKLKLEAKQGKVYCFFVDYQAAFDSIPREALIYKLSCLGLSSKFLNILKTLYSNVNVAIWGNEGTSDIFGTNIGLKQGCLLSPVLFSLYLNDLEQNLTGGLRIAGIRVKVLAFADDVVLIAENPRSLQDMINQLEKYNDRWNLTLNLNKSKVMVFKKRGKLSLNEKWNYKGNEIEIANEYKYLGILLKPNLKIESHIKSKITAAKFGINSVWKGLITRSEYPISAKYRIFDSVFRSVVSYGSQVWGYERVETLEKFQRYFLKKLYFLPQNTPNHVLMLETEKEPLFLYTLKLHFNYILKTLELPKSRLPYILANFTIKKETLWFAEWKRLASEHGITLADRKDWKFQTNNILKAIEINTRNQYLDHLNASKNSWFYSKLQFNMGNKNYITDKNNMRFIRTIIKTRCNVLNLNYKSWKTENTNCSLCNLKEEENIGHFLAICPILSEIRRLYLGKSKLSEEEFFNYLNGENWIQLFNFINKALIYRQELVDEFNF
jgi:hypothetical protein